MANDFSGDTNCQAWWKMEETSGDRYDSKNSNTLADGNTCPSSTTSKEGTYSVSFTAGNSEYLSRSDANLSTNFPLKSTDTTKDFSICFWFRQSSGTVLANLVTKWDSGVNKRSLLIRANSADFDWYNGQGGTAEQIATYSGIANDTWYHCAVSWDDSTKGYICKLWDDGASTYRINSSGTATNNISVYDVAFAAGCQYNSGATYRHWTGLIDELVVFNTPLTGTNLTDIKDGNYVISATGGDIPLFMHHYTKNLRT